MPAGRCHTRRVLAILSVTFPFFALIAIGYLAARSRVLPIAAVPGLNAFVLYFALTCLLFQLGAQTPVATLVDPVTIGVWLLGGLLVMAAAAATARRSGRSWLDAAFGGLIAVTSNSGFMGLPLLIALLGTQVGGPISTTLLVDIVVMQSIVVGMSQLGTGDHGGLGTQVKAVLLRVLKNPLPWAIVLGAVWGTLDLTLPGPVDQVVTMLGTAATPVALFAIGAVLAREQKNTPQGRVRTGIRAFGDVYWLAALKLFGHPLLVWALGQGAIAAGLPLARQTLVVLTLVAALPAAANVSVLAERFGADNGRIARVILVSTVLSFLTFTGAVALLD